ncbi:MAG: response regulator [Polyangiaceae bacterium]
MIRLAHKPRASFRSVADELHCQGTMRDLSSNPHLVLLVDDDVRTSRRMADMLREDGFAVEIARDGAAAVARLARAPVPDAIVTEFNTTHVDGTAVGHFARARRPGIPIIFATGYPHLFQPAAFGSEPPLVLTKPVDYASLRDALTSALLRVSSAEATERSLNPQATDVRVESASADEQGNTVSGAQAVRTL